jgi:predicted metal-binding membrane protein
MAGMDTGPGSDRLIGSDLARHAGGRWFARGVLVVAALNELTPLQDACLSKCRSPVEDLIGAWRAGSLGAAQAGARHGTWCVG